MSDRRNPLSMAHRRRLREWYEIAHPLDTSTARRPAMILVELAAGPLTDAERDYIAELERVRRHGPYINTTARPRILGLGRGTDTGA